MDRTTIQLICILVVLVAMTFSLASHIAKVEKLTDEIKDLRRAIKDKNHSA